VTADPARCPPAPPAGTDGKLLTVELDLVREPCVRLFHKDRKPLAFWRSPTNNRFDPLPAPWHNTNVLYAGSMLEIAIAETLLRWHGDVMPGQRVDISRGGQIAPRRVARFKAKRKLKIIDASGAGMKRIQEVVAAMPAQNPPARADDIFYCDIEEYPQTQAWGAWFRTQEPDADGLRWTSRQFNRGQSLVLFEDRCGDQLKIVGKAVPLNKPRSKERKLVEEMIGDLDWGIIA
jgi:hypothetical protein